MKLRQNEGKTVLFSIVHKSYIIANLHQYVLKYAKNKSA